MDFDAIEAHREAVDEYLGHPWFAEREEDDDTEETSEDHHGDG